MPDSIAHHAALYARMVRAARGLRVLALASWPAAVQRTFLADLARGVERMPQIEYAVPDFDEARRELDAVIGAADPDHPLGAYLIDSARQWQLAARMLG